MDAHCQQDDQQQGDDQQRAGERRRHPDQRNERQQDQWKGRGHEAPEDVVAGDGEIQLNQAFDEKRDRPEQGQEHRYENRFEKQRAYMSDASSRDEIAEENPGERLAEQQRMKGMQLRSEELTQPSVCVEEQQPACARIRHGHRKKKDPSRLTGRQVKQRGEKKRNGEENDRGHGTS